ncbi:Retrotransposon gag protein [Phytophthora infestans]|uniref:Retrotransposon gag protein n=1 Tax=Phytophthora infestans TaxID=4787 RepID=A0A833S5S1_PHYIN|nr:Retrotransposon gag protein [Phytophthora infestans]
MDVSPPSFEGQIEGIKINSFLFRFESYFQKKGYNLALHDHLLPRELNQCVRKTALVWYERYMTDDTTTKLWSVMKSEMIREFREPNFQAKVRNQLLRLKQTGAYHGYVNKLWELHRVVELDELTAINIFVTGLTNTKVRLAIQRKQPTTLTAAAQEGFLKWELQEKHLQPTKAMPAVVLRARNQIMAKTCVIT